LAYEVNGYSTDVLRGFAEGAGTEGRQLLRRLRPLFAFDPTILIDQQTDLLSELEATLK